MLGRPDRSGNKKTLMSSGLRHGETRTRTGDTTIFRIGAEPIESA
jgi:hypothetical protein